MRKHSPVTYVLATLFVMAAVVLSYSLGKRAGEHSHASSSATRVLYSCAMHPSVTSDRPGKCPICHMDLQRIDDAGAMPESDVAGRAPFELSGERQQLIGLTTAKVAKKALERELRASGQVAFDPELFTAIEEYRQAALAGAQFRDNSLGNMKGQADALVESSRTKLRLMGITDAQIKRLADNKTDPMSLILPKGNVWIYAEVYEYEIAGLKVGQEIEVEAPAAPGTKFSGKLTGISPVLNPQTRTVRVRALVPDPQHELRPDTYVNVTIRQSLGERLVVPNDSVLHSGDKDFVFVVKEQGKFVPTTVQIGSKTNESTEILSGVTEGEIVATAANFLLDSEARLRSAAKPAPTGAGK